MYSGGRSGGEAAPADMPLRFVACLLPSPSSCSSRLTLPRLHCSLCLLDHPSFPSPSLTSVPGPLVPEMPHAPGRCLTDTML